MARAAHQSRSEPPGKLDLLRSFLVQSWDETARFNNLLVRLSILLVRRPPHLPHLLLRPCNVQVLSFFRVNTTKHNTVHQHSGAPVVKCLHVTFHRVHRLNGDFLSNMMCMQKPLQTWWLMTYLRICNGKNKSLQIWPSTAVIYYTI